MMAASSLVQSISSIYKLSALMSLPSALVLLLSSATLILAHGAEDLITPPAPATSSAGTTATTATPGISDTASASSAIGLAWLFCALAVLGAALGGLIPLLSKPYDRIQAKEPSKRSRWELGLMAVLADIRGPKFISGALAFATGVLLYGALASLLPSAVSLVRTALGMHAAMVVLVVWFCGIAFMMGVRLAVDRFQLDQFNPGNAACPCHGASKDATNNGADVECCQPVDEGKQDAQLKKWGWMTVAAVALHKIPEGMIAFISIVVSLQFGASLAIAILLHNIPEAIAISVPLFKATGSYLVAFLAPVLAASFQLIGAGIAHALLSVGISRVAEGLIYALAAGMLMYIAVRGLWTSAITFERRIIGAIPGAWVSHWLFAGAGIMFLTSAIFSYV